MAGQIHTVLSYLTLAKRRRPSGLNATQSTASVRPVSGHRWAGRYRESTSAPVLASFVLCLPDLLGLIALAPSWTQPLLRRPLG
jgi:hypothetical protein